MHNNNDNGAQCCPICRKPTQFDYRPFCSKRCADVDLGRWLTGRYAIASHTDDDEDGETIGLRSDHDDD